MKFEANKEFMENLSLHMLLDGTGNMKDKNELVFFDKNFINVMAHFWPAKLRTATKTLRSHSYPNIFNQKFCYVLCHWSSGFTLFKTLDANKSSIDIPNKRIRLAADPPLAPFTQINNQSDQSIETSIVPNVLKVSQVNPVYKNGHVTHPGNYRPISTWSQFSKVFGRLI